MVAWLVGSLLTPGGRFGDSPEYWNLTSILGYPQMASSLSQMPQSESLTLHHVCSLLSPVKLEASIQFASLPLTSDFDCQVCSWFGVALTGHRNHPESS